MHRTPLPQAADLFALSADRIHRAAADLWPCEPLTLGDHVPSVTGYVHRASIGGRDVFAKDSILGLSLVSVLRGVAGDRDMVRAAQAAYATSPASLLAREAAQLRALDASGVRVGRCAGYAAGVLFTEPVTGPTLANLITKDPGRTYDLLSTAVAALESLQRPQVASQVDAASIPERSIDGTFRRKFNGVSGRLYVERLGLDRVDERRRRNVAAVVGAVVARLLKLRLIPPTGPAVIVYGDLKPEHVLFPDGPTEAPVFIDPSLARGPACHDTAKLVSRTFLALLAAPHLDGPASTVVDGIGEFVAGRMRTLHGPARTLWLRRLLVTWLMDTVNILSTYLTAPATLPLPEHAQAVIDRSETLCSLLDLVSAPLAAGTDPETAWRLALRTVSRAADR
ncbi:phosphotransferase [Streptomyces broussonetiae]|uniref:Phosphotransferase n=1 Tax=Streptomyces broussonetiae TaxID=2686304 RepID=A0A6I6NGH5_9ACTN|nr:phosphotransferase [Streptomyces broussonetiae]QHA09310.1 phosphotransferase [Streptomyces broussonetiae]